MSLTDGRVVDELTARLFETAIVPAAKARREEGQPEYFPIGPAPEAESYFIPVSSGKRYVYEYPGGGTPDGLIDAAAILWAEQNEVALAKISADLRNIAEVIQVEQSQSSDKVDIYCYTMF